MTTSATRQRVRPYRSPTLRVGRVSSGTPLVVCICDSRIVPEGLRRSLGDRGEVVADATTGTEAVGLCQLFVPDVVVASELLADGVVESFVPALLRTGARVLVVCEPRETSELVELVALGVTGLVTTDGTPEDLVHAVLGLAAGGAVLPEDVVAAVAADWRRSRRERGGDGRSAELTEREREVLGAISDGLSTKAVAHHLGIAVKTVEHHKSRIFDKLGVRTQAEAVAVALGTDDLTAAGAGAGTGVDAGSGASSGSGSRSGSGSGSGSGSHSDRPAS